MDNILIYPNTQQIDRPAIFLAGPIHGAPNWQERAIKILRKNNKNVFIISPRMIEEEVLSEAEIIRKIDWETGYLQQVAKNGVMLFWLAKQEQSVTSQSYAQSTRFELGEWKEKYRLSKFNFVVGIEPGFAGEVYIRHRLTIDCPGLKITSTLEKVCEEASSLF